MRRVRLLPHPSQQAGVSLVELMVAILISLLLLAGLVTIFSSMRQSYDTSQQLSQLTGDEQLASTVLTATVKNAGYYPLSNRTLSGEYPQFTNAFPAGQTISVDGTTLTFAADGQTITGAAGPNGDIVATRTFSNNTDTVMGCLGNPVFASAATVTTISAIWVDPANNSLMCATKEINDQGAVVQAPRPEPLIGDDSMPGSQAKGGVTKLQVAFGVDTTANGTVNRYYDPAALNAAANTCPDIVNFAKNDSSCWLYVKSLRVDLYFLNALDSTKQFRVSRAIVLPNMQGRYIEPISD